MSIKLGDKVRDKITGLVGIAVCHSEWLNGCIRIVVQPQELKDGKPVDATCFDEPSLELVPDEVPVEHTRTSGGGRDDSKAVSR